MPGTGSSREGVWVGQIVTGYPLEDATPRRRWSPTRCRACRISGRCTLCIHEMEGLPTHRATGAEVALQEMWAAAMGWVEEEGRLVGGAR